MSIKSNQKPTTPLPELCVAVRTIREEMEMSRDDFAKHLGSTAQTVYRFETGRQVPRRLSILRTLRTLARDGGFAKIVRLVDSQLRENDPEDSFESPELAAEISTSHHDAWRLILKARIAQHFYPEYAKAMAEAAGPAGSLVDDVLRSAQIPERLDASFYRAMEQSAWARAERLAFENFQKGDSK